MGRKELRDGGEPHELKEVETGSLKTGKHSIELEDSGELEVTSESLN